MSVLFVKYRSAKRKLKDAFELAEISKMDTQASVEHQRNDITILESMGDESEIKDD